jgi:general secretion pathway protein A
MYLDFYGLREPPFSATPDPKFLYLTPAHREALAQLLYGVQQGKGFLVLTGEVGTGKTTLLHTLLQRLDASTAVAFIMNSTMPFDGILEYMLEDFGIASPGQSRARRLFALNRFLIERHREGQNTVVIVDEAQNLSPATLEQVRLLSNFETPAGKLMQILLVGQPELRDKLARPELRQLKQRIGLRCTIRPLSPEETRDYIRNRLRVAGAADTRLFTDAAIERIAEYTGGTPRLVNIVCDHCLLMGYAEQTRRVERDRVDQAIRYLEEGGAPARPRRAAARPAAPLRWALGGLGAAAAAMSLLFVTGMRDAEMVLSSLLAHVVNIARGARDLVMR